MTHNQQNVERHHEGDAAELHITVEDDNGNVMDLTGAEVEWYMTDNKTDDPGDAYITKTGTEGGTTDGVEFTDAANGQLKVIINTNETDAIVTWTEFPDESKQFHHRIRVTDADGRRVTGFTGNFEILP